MSPRPRLSSLPFAAFLTAVVALAGAAGAQVEGQKVPAAAPENAAPVHDIARWIDDSIFGVVMVDVARIDVGALIGQLAQFADRSQPGPAVKQEELTQMKAQLLSARDEFDAWVTEYKAAGGGNVWFLMAPQPAVCFLTTEGADIDKLRGMIGKLEFAEGGKTIFRKGVIIAGSTLRGLPTDEPNPDRAEQLKVALEAAKTPSTEDPVVRLVLIPTDAHRLLMAGLVPHISQMVDVQVAKDLNTKIRWGAAAASNIPNPEVHAVIQTTGAQPAQQVAALANGLLGKGARDVPPGPLVEVLRELKFLVNEDRAELRVSTTAMKRLTEGMVVPILAAREAARRTVAMSHNRQYLVGVMTYAAEHEDKLPASLDDLKEYLGGADLVHPDGKKWTYVKPAAKLSELENPSLTVILHEEYKAWPPKGLIVGFADGHVEVVETEERLKDLLKNR
jgi:prepilin-type processing-associated H-X9-DG protein